MSGLAAVSAGAGGSSTPETVLLPIRALWVRWDGVSDSSPEFDYAFAEAAIAIDLWQTNGLGNSNPAPPRVARCLANVWTKAYAVQVVRQDAANDFGARVIVLNVGSVSTRRFFAVISARSEVVRGYLSDGSVPAVVTQSAPADGDAPLGSFRAFRARTSLLRRLIG